MVEVMTHEIQGGSGQLWPVQQGTLRGSPDADTLLIASRPEFYDLAAKVIAAQARRDAVIRLARPPYGLITFDNMAKPPGERLVTELHSWDEMHDAMVWTGMRGVESFFASRQTFTMAATLYKFKKMAQMFDSLDSAGSGAEQPSDAAETIMTGAFVTGLHVIVGGLQSTGQVAQAAMPYASGKQVADIVRRSYRVVTQPATTARDNLKHTLNAIDIAPKSKESRLQIGAFTRVNPDLLALDIQKSYTNVQYEKPFKDHVDKVLGKKIADMQARFPALGCPALRNMVIRQYWEWGADVAYRAGFWGAPEPAAN